MKLYLQSPVSLHGGMLNYLSAGITLITGFRIVLVNFSLADMYRFVSSDTVGDMLPGRAAGKHCHTENIRRNFCRPIYA
jgi:hypothetical protein